MLNRKDHTASFKAITRGKRDSVLDGTGVAQEPKPCPGQYRPRFTVVESEARCNKILDEKRAMSFDQRQRMKKTLSNSEQGIVDFKLLHALQKDVETERQKRYYALRGNRQMHHLHNEELNVVSQATLKELQGEVKVIGTAEGNTLTISEDREEITQLSDFSNINAADQISPKKFNRNSKLHDRSSTLDAKDIKKGILDDNKQFRKKEDSRLAKLRTVIEHEKKESESGISQNHGSKEDQAQMDGEMTNRQSVDDYQKKNRYVNLKKESFQFKSDPYLPFQNIKLDNDYYIVPTQNFDWDKTNPLAGLQDKPRVALEIHKIENPTTQRREPIKPVAIDMNFVDVTKVSNPNDKNTLVRLKERQK